MTPCWERAHRWPPSAARGLQASVSPAPSSSANPSALPPTTPRRTPAPSQGGGGAAGVGPSSQSIGGRCPSCARGRRRPGLFTGRLCPCGGGWQRRRRRAQSPTTASLALAAAPRPHGAAAACWSSTLLVIGYLAVQSRREYAPPQRPRRGSRDRGGGARDRVPLPRAQAPQANALDRLERLLGRRAGARATLHYHAMADRRSSLAESLSALGLFSVLIAVLIAGSVIGSWLRLQRRSVVLLAIQTATALTVWRFGWQRVSEPWRLVVVGAQAVFVICLITLTGGPASPYFALYARVLALAGWHLRPVHAGIAVAFAAGIELWRVLVVEVSASFDHLAKGVLVLLAGMNPPGASLRRLARNRRDQVRTAATLRVMCACAATTGSTSRSTLLRPGRSLRAQTRRSRPSRVIQTLAAASGPRKERMDTSRCPSMRLEPARAGSASAAPPRSRPAEAAPGGHLADALGNQHEHRRLFEDVRTDARRDHLTGLLNRSAFDRQRSAGGRRSPGRRARR